MGAQTWNHVWWVLEASNVVTSEYFPEFCERENMEKTLISHSDEMYYVDALQIILALTPCCSFEHVTLFITHNFRMFFLSISLMAVNRWIILYSNSTMTSLFFMSFQFRCHFHSDLHTLSKFQLIIFSDKFPFMCIHVFFAN